MEKQRCHKVKSATQKKKDLQFYGKENNTMAEWAKEIMILANDFCLNMAKAKEIVTEVDTITVPQGKDESRYKYDRAWSRLKPMLLQ